VIPSPLAPRSCDSPPLAGLWNPLDPSNIIPLQCVRTPAEDGISGTLTLTPGTNADDWLVDVVQNLDFTILADLRAGGIPAIVTIASSSVTELSGEGTGQVPGEIVLTEFLDEISWSDGDPLGCSTLGPFDLPQNMTVDLSEGTVQCLALNPSFAGDPCNCACEDGPCEPDFANFEQNCLGAAAGQTPPGTQTCGCIEPGFCDPVDLSGPAVNPQAVCNLAGLPIEFCVNFPNDTTDPSQAGCFYSLPVTGPLCAKPLDNLARLFPDIVTSEVGGTGSAAECTGMVWTLGEGDTDVGGYYRVNQYDPTSGPQFLNLGGVQQ